MIRVYTFGNSNNSLKPKILLEEAGIPYEIVAIDLHSQQHRGADYLTVNPFGQVPTLEVDGERLYESNAILRYLARRFAPHLYSTELHAAYEIDLWLDLLSTGYRQASWPMEQVTLGGKRPEDGPLHRGIGLVDQLVGFDELTRYTEMSMAYLKVCDRIHPGRWIGGEYSIADIAWTCSFERLQRMRVSLESMPRLSQWSRDILARPSAVRALARTE